MCNTRNPLALTGCALFSSASPLAREADSTCIDGHDTAGAPEPNLR
jgi:hypothetical protein